MRPPYLQFSGGRGNPSRWPGLPSDNLHVFSRVVHSGGQVDRWGLWECEWKMGPCPSILLAVSKNSFWQCAGTWRDRFRISPALPVYVAYCTKSALPNCSLSCAKIVSLSQISLLESLAQGSRVDNFAESSCQLSGILQWLIECTSKVVLNIRVRRQPLVFPTPNHPSSMYNLPLVVQEMTASRTTAAGHPSMATNYCLHATCPNWDLNFCSSVFLMESLWQPFKPKDFWILFQARYLRPSRRHLSLRLKCQLKTSAVGVLELVRS